MTTTLSADHATLQSFFYAELGQAQRRSGRTLPEDVAAYLVDLLARFARRTAVAGRTSAPLATEYLGAKSKRGRERARALRGVGDRALYIAGVVPRSMDRTPVSVRYVRAIGEAAYHEVSTPSGPLRVFAVLADAFADAARVMGEVVEGAAGEVPEDLLTVYERWRAHGHDRDLERLIRAGVLIDPDRSDTPQ